MTYAQKSMRVEKVAKSDNGLLVGYLLVSKTWNEKTQSYDCYCDLQGDHVPDDVILKASVNFMRGKRTLKAMHDGDQIGEVVQAFALTEDMCGTLGIKAERCGLLIAAKPDSDEVLKKFDSGEYTGFSIGGQISGRRNGGKE